MPYFDRFDIAEAHYAVELDYNVSGILQERPSNKRREMSTAFQLKRMGFKPGLMFAGFDTLSENGQEIYQELVERYGLPVYDENCSECTENETCSDCLAAQE
jgi:hypothetical protein